MFNIVNLGLKFAFLLWQKKVTFVNVIIIIIIIIIVVVVVVVIIYSEFAPSAGPDINMVPDKWKW